MAERRRLIIIIVEGKSEENALSSLMKCLFSPDEVIFHIMNGDMMTKNQKNITRIVESIVGEESRRYGLQRSDIKTVIQLTDTDGCFIPDEYIIEDESLSHIEYTVECIRTPFPLSIQQRNSKRRRNILTLISHRLLKGKLPYSIYYFSRNIEHALYGIERAVSDSRKTDLAYEFSDRFSYNTKAFMDYLEEEDICPGDDYQSSWEALENDRESLKRHSNLILLFSDNTRK